MRLYFEDDKGERVALETEAETFCTTLTGDTIDNDHRFVKVSGFDLNQIIMEADFNCWGHDDWWLTGKAKPEEQEDVPF